MGNHPFQAGQTHVVDADVAQYFDPIPHKDLLKCVARRIADGKILRLIKLWLKSPVEEENESGLAGGSAPQNWGQADLPAQNGDRTAADRYLPENHRDRTSADRHLSVNHRDRTSADRYLPANHRDRTAADRYLPANQRARTSAGNDLQAHHRARTSARNDLRAHHRARTSAHRDPHGANPADPGGKGLCPVARCSPVVGKRV